MLITTEVKTIFKFFVIWRISLLVIGFLGLTFFGNTPVSVNDYLIKWAQHDGGHFRGIAEHSYLPQQTVFFPGYPILIYLLQQFGLPSLYGGLLVSNIAGFISLLLLYKLFRLDFTQNLSKQLVVAFLAFPTSFYFGALYSESLFLVFTLGAFYAARKQSWVLASILAGLSLSVRFIGLAVVIAIIFEYLVGAKTLQIKLTTFQRKFIQTFLMTEIIYICLKNLFSFYTLFFYAHILEIIINLSVGLFLIMLLFYFTQQLLKSIDLQKLKSLTLILLMSSFLPLFLYASYLDYLGSNPLSFINNQVGWGRFLSAPWQPIINSLEALFFNDHFQWIGSFQNLFEIIFTIGAIGVLIFLSKKLRAAYIVFFLISILIPLSSGLLFAMPRYILVIFPIYICFVYINQSDRKYYLIFSSGVLILLTILYLNNYPLT